MHCHHCDSSVLEGGRFCPNCGHRLEAAPSSTGRLPAGDATLLTPALAAPPPAGATCESCGAAAPAGETLCESCFKVFGTVLGSALPPIPAAMPDAPTQLFGAPETSLVDAGPLEAATVLAPALTGAIPTAAPIASAPAVADEGYSDEEEDEDEIDYEEGDVPEAEASTLPFSDAPTRAVSIQQPWNPVAPASQNPVTDTPSFEWTNSASVPRREGTGSSSWPSSGSHVAADAASPAEDVPWWERPVTSVPDVPEFAEAYPVAPTPAMPPVVEAVFEPMGPPAVPASHLPAAAPPASPDVTPAAVISYSPAPAQQGMHEVELPAVPTVSHDYRPVGFQNGTEMHPRPETPAPRPRPQPVPAVPAAPRAAVGRSQRQPLLIAGAVAAVAVAIGVPIVWRTMHATPAPVAAVQEYRAPTATPAAAAAAAPVAPPTFDDLAPPPTPKPLEPVAAGARPSAPSRKKKPAPAPAKTVAPVVPAPAPLLSSSAPALVAAPQPVAAPVAAPEPTRVDAGPIGQIHELSQVDQKPQVASRTDPALPAALAGQRIEDVVILRVLVSPSGHPAEVRVLRHARSGESLDAVAVAAVRRWTFSPARRKGQAVACWYNVGVPFKN